MANFCEYEIHVKGNKKAVLYFFTMVPSYGGNRITHEEGSDDEYIIWITGDCKNALDCYCEEKPGVAIDLDGISEADIRNKELGSDYMYLTMRQKSEVLGIEILAHSWSDESDFDQFDYYSKGTLISSESYCFAPPTWFRSDDETYEQFCKENNIDPEKIPEKAWYEIDNDVLECDCDFLEDISRFTFEF